MAVSLSQAELKLVPNCSLRGCCRIGQWVPKLEVRLKLPSMKGQTAVAVLNMRFCDECKKATGLDDMKSVVKKELGKPLKLSWLSVDSPEARQWMAAFRKMGSQ